MTDTLSGSTCPPECRVRLKALEAHKAECERDRRETYKHWEEEIKKMTPQRIFFWLIGVLVVVLCASFGALYTQGAKVQDKIGGVHARITDVQESVHEVQMDVMKAQTQIEELNKPRICPSDPP